MKIKYIFLLCSTSSGDATCIVSAVFKPQTQRFFFHCLLNTPISCGCLTHASCDVYCILPLKQEGRSCYCAAKTAVLQLSDNWDTCRVLGQTQGQNCPVMIFTSPLWERQQETRLGEPCLRQKCQLRPLSTTDLVACWPCIYYNNLQTLLKGYSVFVCFN